MEHIFLIAAALLTGCICVLCIWKSTRKTHKEEEAAEQRFQMILKEMEHNAPSF